MMGGQKIVQLLSHFMGEGVELFTFGDGEALGSRNVDADVLVYLVPRREVATGDFKMDDETRDLVSKLFGMMPFGLVNQVSESPQRFDAKQIIKGFTPPAEKDRQPNAKTAPKPFKFPEGT
jgi:hypothetical protein